MLTRVDTAPTFSIRRHRTEWQHIPSTRGARLHAEHVSASYLHFDKTRRGVQMNGLRILDSPVRAVLSEAGCVVKEACSNGFLDCIVVTQVAGQLNLSSVHQAQQLFSDVPHPLHDFHLLRCHDLLFMPL